jgi:internalin A
MLILLFVLASTAWADSAAWVREQGGVAGTDAQGRVVSVSFRSGWVTDGDLDRLAVLPDLRILDLSYTHITDLGMERLKRLEGIEELGLRYAEHVTDEGIAHLRGWKKLRKIDARGTKITDNGLAHLSTLATLEWLDCGYAEVTNSGLDVLASLPALKHLAIGGNKLSDAGLHFLRLLPGLRSLDLSGSQRTDSGLWFVALTDAGLDSVTAIPELEELYIAETKVTDLGVAKLARLKNLRVLDLGGTPVTARGLAALKASAIEELRLYKAEKVGDDALPHLVAMPRLSAVDVRDTGLSEAGRAKLGSKML